MDNIEKINLIEKSKLILEYWNPKIVGEMGDNYVKLAKLKGEFIFHKHDNEDEMFLVVKGTLTIDFRHKKIILNEGEFIIIPKGIEHKPVCDEESIVMLFEPKTTINTGNIINERTIKKNDKI